MPNRTTFSLTGLSPQVAVAADLVSVGDLFFTSGIRGVDLRTGELPEDPSEQMLNAWHNLAALVQGAGFSTDNIGLVTNFIAAQEYRPFINPGWLELFPRADNRPARKTTSFPLPPGVGVELQAFGVRGGQRTCIEVPGLRHRDPLPNAARLGDYVFTSVIVPWDLATSETVIGEDAQTDQCFDNMRLVMEQAGGTLDDVVLQWVYLNDFAYQPYMVDVYLEAWPIGHYQAARKTFRYPLAAQIQIQCIGRIGGGRSNHEIPGHGHHDPIPMGARIGDLYASSGVSGVNPQGEDKLEPVEGAAGQAYYGLRNIQSLAESGGLSADDIGHITVLVQDYADVPAIDREWCAMFPDPANRPARQVMQLGLQRRSRAQFHMLAVSST
ncbi:MAG TPA: RidA family protein [Chloroflexota bacterium]|nr:RidA family protein [Chloroflexota bacterium]